MTDNYDSKRHIKILNKYLGMNHRIERYNLSEASDLKDALEYAVAAYRDYYHYSCTLSEIVENFDESIEYFDTESWVNMTASRKTADSLVMDCVGSLSDTNENFYNLAKKAEMHLSVLLKVVLTAPDAVQVEILGKAFDISPADIDEWLEGLFKALGEAEYHHSIPENYSEFLAVIEAGWEDDAPVTEPDFEPGFLPF